MKDLLYSIYNMFICELTCNGFSPCQIPISIMGSSFKNIHFIKDSCVDKRMFTYDINCISLFYRN